MNKRVHDHYVGEQVVFIQGLDERPYDTFDNQAQREYPAVVGAVLKDVLVLHVSTISRGIVSRSVSHQALDLPYEGQEGWGWRKV